MLGKKNVMEQLLKKMTPSDIALIKLSCISLGLLLATYFEKIAEIDPVYYLAATIIFAIKPLMLYFKK